MKRNVILTCDQKPTRVRVIYSTEQQQTGENKKSGRLKSKKLICSEVSVKSPGNPWSQSRRRKGRLWWERLTEKESFKPGVEK